MKRTISALACALALVAPAWASAQQAAPGTAANASAIDPTVLAKLRERIRADRKAVVAKNLPLTEAEAKAFWPVYDKCRESFDGPQRKLNRAILDYVDAEARLSDANAKRIANEALEAEAEGTKARRACFDRVAKVLPGKKAARYLQIETKIAALEKFDAAVVIPLAD